MYEPVKIEYWGNQRLVCLTWSKFLARYHHVCIFFIHLKPYPFLFMLKPWIQMTNHAIRWYAIIWQKKAKHSFLVKRCLIATLELNAIHCVIYMVRRYIVLYGGKSMEGNMCNNLDNGHSACVWFLVSCLVVELCSLKFVA